MTSRSRGAVGWGAGWGGALSVGGCCVGLGDRRRTTGSKCSQPSSCRVGLFLLLCRRASAPHLAAPSPRPRVPPQSRRNGHPRLLSSQALRLSEARDAWGLSQVGDGGESGDLLREGACTGRGGCQGLTKNPGLRGLLRVSPKQSSAAGPPAEARRVHQCVWQRSRGLPGGQSVLRGELWPPWGVSAACHPQKG